MLTLTIKKTLTLSLTAAVLLASMPAVANGTSYDVANQELSFFAPGDGDAEILAGADATTAPYRYENVITISGTRIDALVSVVDLANSEYENDADEVFPNKLDRLDKTNELVTEDQAKELEAGFRNSASSENVEGYAIFDVQFVLSGTSTAVTLSNVVVSVADIDNNQFVQFSGLSSYKLSPEITVFDEDTQADIDVDSRVSPLTGDASLTTSRGANLSTSVPLGSVMFFASESSDDYSDASGSTDEADDIFVAQVNFSNVSTLRAKMGSFETGSASLDFSFSSFGNFSTVPEVAVTQPSFTVTYDANTGTGTLPSATTGTGSLTVAGSLTTPGITKAGFTFAGWNTRADGTGVSYAPGSTILPVANITLYAVWIVAPTPVLATTGPDLNGGWIATGLISGVGLALLGFRRALRRKVG